MNLAAFAVIVARERETGLGDDISSLYGLGADRPLLAWPMTIAMLALAGFPVDRRVLREGLSDRRGRRQRLRVARHRDRARVRRVARVLPAGGRGGVDARPVRGARDPAAGPPGDRRRVAGGRRGTARPVASPARQSSDRPTRARSSPRITTTTGLRRPAAAPARGRVRRGLCACVTVAFGIYPEPLFGVARDAGDALRLWSRACGGRACPAQPYGGRVRSPRRPVRLRSSTSPRSPSWRRCSLVAAPAVGAPDIPRRRPELRLGICLVASDVCWLKRPKAPGSRPARSVRHRGS